MVLSLRFTVMILQLGRKYRDPGTPVAMRKRNARISTHGKCSRQPRYDPIGDPLGLEPLDLLGCPCKDRRVPTLETNHTLTVPSRLDDQIIDLRLRPCPPIASLTHTNSLAARRSKL